MFAIAVFIRPNVSVGVLCLLIYLLLYSIKKGGESKILFFLIGLSFACVMPIHNYYFGLKFRLIMFSSPYFDKNS